MTPDIPSTGFFERVPLFAGFTGLTGGDVDSSSPLHSPPMRALVQRVSSASVTVESEVVGEIGPGLCVLVGITHDDTPAQAVAIAEKLWHLRIFDDADGVMNLSAEATGAEILVVSQFTLYGDARKGRRPTWIDAARPEVAEPLVEAVVTYLQSLGATVATGRFRTDMAVSLINDGPVTLMLEL